jgi:hypothetical protein
MKTMLKTILTLLATGVALFSISLSALFQGCKSSGKAGNGNATPNPPANQPPQPPWHGHLICDPVHQPRTPSDDRIGGILARLNPQQKARLQQQSPQTLLTLAHNDAVYQHQQQRAAQAQTPPPPAEALTPLTVADIKALDSAGVKKDVIIDEIKRSQSVYTQADITALQQSNPNIDPAIIKCMKNPS